MKSNLYFCWRFTGRREKFAFLYFLFPNLSSVFKDDRTLCKTSFRCYFSRLLYSHKQLRMNTTSLIMVLALFLTMKATTGQPSDIILLFAMPLILLLEWWFNLIRINNSCERLTCENNSFIIISLIVSYVSAYISKW